MDSNEQDDGIIKQPNEGSTLSDNHPSKKTNLVKIGIIAVVALVVGVLGVFSGIFVGNLLELGRNKVEIPSDELMEEVCTKHGGSFSIIVEEEETSIETPFRRGSCKIPNTPDEYFSVRFFRKDLPELMVDLIEKYSDDTDKNSRWSSICSDKVSCYYAYSIAPIGQGSTLSIEPIDDTTEYFKGIVSVNGITVSKNRYTIIAFKNIAASAMLDSDNSNALLLLELGLWK